MSRNMFELWILIAVATLFLLRSIRRLFFNRFPHPIDVATVSIYYYSVPLAVAAALSIKTVYPLFLTEAASDPGLATLSMRMVVLALVAMTVGRFLAFLPLPPVIRWKFQINEISIRPLRGWYLVLFSLAILGIFLYGWQEFLNGYAGKSLRPTGDIGNGLIFFTIEALGIALAFSVLARVRDRQVAT